LAERALGHIAENILRWTAHTGDDLIGYGFQDANMGAELVQKKEHTDPKELYVTAILSHHIPTDELQQINAATIMMRELGISFIDAAKKLDIPNPEELLERANQEKLNNAAVDRRIRKMDAELDLQIQAQQMQLEAGMQQQMMAAQQQPQQPSGMNAESESQARMAIASPFAPSRTGAERKLAQSLATRGPGFDPSAGGLSPNEVNPEGFTKEGSTGVDRGGGTI
jgi:hypothetical protein